jgi:hypothetical protein
MEEVKGDDSQREWGDFGCVEDCDEPSNQDEFEPTVWDHP